jgi:hypothetical protein
MGRAVLNEDILNPAKEFYNLSQKLELMLAAQLWNLGSTRSS